MSAKVESLPLQKGISFNVRMIALAVLVALVAVVGSIVAIRAMGSSQDVRQPTVPTKVNEQQPTVPTNVNGGTDQSYRIGNHFVS